MQSAAKALLLRGCHHLCFGFAASIHNRCEKKKSGSRVESALTCAWREGGRSITKSEGSITKSNSQNKLFQRSLAVIPPPVETHQLRPNHVLVRPTSPPPLTPTICPFLSKEVVQSKAIICFLLSVAFKGPSWLLYHTHLSENVE